MFLLLIQYHARVFIDSAVSPHFIYFIILTSCETDETSKRLIKKIMPYSGHVGLGLIESYYKTSRKLTSTRYQIDIEFHYKIIETIKSTSDKNDNEKRK